MFLGTVMICGCAIADTSTVDRVDFGKIGLGTPMYTADGVTNEIAKAIAGGGGGADPALYQLATNAYDIATNAYNVTTNVLESKADATFTGIVYLMTTNTRFASYLVSEIP